MGCHIDRQFFELHALDIVNTLLQEIDLKVSQLEIECALILNK